MKCGRRAAIQPADGCQAASTPAARSDDWISAAAVKGIRRDEIGPQSMGYGGSQTSMECLLTRHHPSGDVVHWGKMFADQPSCPAPMRWGNGWHDRISMFFIYSAGRFESFPFHHSRHSR